MTERKAGNAVRTRPANSSLKPIALSPRGWWAGSTNNTVGARSLRAIDGPLANPASLRPSAPRPAIHCDREALEWPAGARRTCDGLALALAGPISAGAETPLASRIARLAPEHEAGGTRCHDHGGEVASLIL